MPGSLYAVRLDQDPPGSYVFVGAYEFDDGELEEREDDFDRSAVTFSGDSESADFVMTAVEPDDGGTETKVYRKVGVVPIDDVNYYLFEKQSEFKAGYQYNGTSEDDDERGVCSG